MEPADDQFHSAFSHESVFGNLFGQWRLTPLPVKITNVNNYLVI